METHTMNLEDQIAIAKKIFLGAIADKHGYCGCPRCGGRDLDHDGTALDDGYIICCEIDCRYNITGFDAHEMISRWNAENRSSFQLRIPYPPPY